MIVKYFVCTLQEQRPMCCKVRPGQNFPMVKNVKNHRRHVIEYTLNMEEMILI